MTGATDSGRWSATASIAKNSAALLAIPRFGDQRLEALLVEAGDVFDVDEEARRAFEDLDGHNWAINYMDPAHMQPG